MSEVSTSHSGDIENGAHGMSVVQVTIPNQPVQVQSVIQANQPSVIQTAAGPNVQTIQVYRVASAEDELSDDPDGRKRREILARRPSYRKILNDLSSDPPSIPGVSKIEEESNSSQSQDGQESNEAATNLTSTSNAIQYQPTIVSTPGALHLAQDSSASQGLQTITMASGAGGVSPAGATIVQYAQGADGQFFIPVGGSNVQAYQIATSLPQGVVMSSAGHAIGGSQIMEEAARKRELRLLKNRDAAKECRRKKKEYVKCVENRVAVLENQNKTLIEELKALKELYCQKDDLV